MLFLDQSLEKIHLPELRRPRLLVARRQLFGPVDEALEVLRICFLQVLSELVLAL